jgi:oleandomycin transport system ATP-binding protein
MTMTDYPIQAEGLTKRYRSTTALDGVDLAVLPGTVLALLGPNGAGKTTVVRILATLLRPDGGSARVGGFDVVRQARQARALIGLTGQFAAVDDALTGYENLLLIGRLLDLSRPQARVRASELLAGFGLAEAARRTVKTYSGGMRRRLDVAASLVGRPRVLFLDEPTTGLDPASRGEVWDRIRSLAADGTAVLLTTHYLDEADRLATEVVVLDHGKVIEPHPGSAWSAAPRCRQRPGPGGPGRRAGPVRRGRGHPQRGRGHAGHGPRRRADLGAGAAGHGRYRHPGRGGPAARRSRDRGHRAGRAAGQPG